MQVDLVTKEKAIPPCDLYYDMKYSLSYLTFANIVIGNLLLFWVIFYLLLVERAIIFILHEI